MKSISEARSCFLKETEKNELMSKKYKKVCTTLNYIEQFIVLASTIAGCISVSAFASFIGIPVWITSSAIWLQICAIAAKIKKYKIIIKRKKKEHDKIVLLAKSKLNNMKVLTSKALIDSDISNDEFALINNALKEYGRGNKKCKDLNISLEVLIYLWNNVIVLFSKRTGNWKQVIIL